MSQSRLDHFGDNRKQQIITARKGKSEEMTHEISAQNRTLVLEQRRIYERNRRAKQTPVQKANVREKNRLSTKSKREAMTLEERAHAREKHRLYEISRREAMTPEEKADARKKQRLYESSRRSSAKLSRSMDIPDKQRLCYESKQKDIALYQSEKQDAESPEIMETNRTEHTPECAISRESHQILTQVSKRKLSVEVQTEVQVDNSKRQRFIYVTEVKNATSVAFI
jgi:hypothetical protein